MTELPALHCTALPSRESHSELWQHLAIFRYSTPSPVGRKKTLDKKGLRKTGTFMRSFQQLSPQLTQDRAGGPVHTQEMARMESNAN